MTSPEPHNPYATEDERNWVFTAHIGGVIGALIGGVCGWIAPLIAFYAHGRESDAVREHALEALNFQLTWTLVAAVGWALQSFFIGWAGILGSMIVGGAFGVIGAIRASEGKLFKYPLSYKFYS
jgi:uncharacterized Tic20 family protein